MGEGKETIRRCRLLLLFGIERRSGSPTDQADFERTLDTLGIVGCQASGGCGIASHQLFMQRRPALLFGARVDFGADFWVGLRQIGEAFKQCLDVEHGTADE